MNKFWTYWCINAFPICNFMWCIHLHAIYPSVRMHVYMYHLVTKQVCCLIGTKFINTRLNVAVIGTNCLLHEVSLPPSSKNFFLFVFVFVCGLIWSLVRAVILGFSSCFRETCCLPSYFPVFLFCPVPVTSLSDPCYEKNKLITCNQLWWVQLMLRDG